MLQTCPASAASCTEAQQGTGWVLNNNTFVMEYLDDGDPSTFTSSTADLELPPDATVLFAGLYYGARTTRGTGGLAPRNPTVAGRSTVKFQSPRPAGLPDARPTPGRYSTPAAAASTRGSSSVTALVAAAGSGTYAVADVQAGTGQDRFAAWALVVAYRDTAQPARSLAVFDGLVSVSPGVDTSSTVTGLRTPAAGPGADGRRRGGVRRRRRSIGRGAEPERPAARQRPKPAEQLLQQHDLELLGVLFDGQETSISRTSSASTPISSRRTGVLPNGATSAVLRASSTPTRRLGRILSPRRLHIRHRPPRPDDRSCEGGRERDESGRAGSAGGHASVHGRRRRRSGRSRRLRGSTT